ncbi:hypothetical protein [Jannaschia sp. R86511]|uniref:hypothetical protein n=1 Tax=Jannaschia sp. R86511 TaxID=3093853 RepID=UPI0036D3526C
MSDQRRPPDEPQPQVGDLGHDHAPGRGWLLTALVLTVLAVVAGLGASLARVPALWVLVGLLLLVAGVLVVHEALAPRAVRGTVDGVAVRARWWRTHVPWERLRRVRLADETSWSRGRDACLDRDGGRLVRLPAGLPSGTVERWREQVGGARPAETLPQTWRQPQPDQWALVLTGIAMVFNLASAVSRSDLVFGLLSGGILLLTAVAGVALWRRGPQVRADLRGLTVRAVRRRHVPWSEVTEVRPADRYYRSAVVVRPDGSTRRLLSVPVDVVRHWQALAEGPR